MIGHYENTLSHVALSESVGYLREAGLSRSQRPASIRLALEAAVRGVPAAGTALLRPGGDTLRRVDYVGERNREMTRWLRERLDDSPETTAAALSETPPFLPGTNPMLFALHPGSPSMSGLWIVWPRGTPDGESMERVRREMETLIEVECMERVHFGGEGVLDRDLALSLRARDEDGLPEMLALARDVSGADFTYWGGVHEGVVDVEWNVGAKNSGFGFELPLGEGVGGRVFARGEAFDIPDYRNCQYRYPGVSDATDDEEVRSVLAVPVRGGGEGSGGVLYAVRRTVAPFSDADRALLLRVKSDIEPVSGAWTAPRRLFTSGLDYLKMKKNELRRLLLECDRVRELEAWMEQLLGGAAILTDGAGHPYVPANLDRLERLRIHAQDDVRTFPLNGPSARGRLHLRPSASLPLEGWPDLIEDALAAFNVVIDRVEQAHDRLNRRRSHWIQSVAEGRANRGSRREGYRLGLPVEKGEVWAFAWEPETAREQTRLRMLADDVVLDQLGGPLIVLDDGVGVVLLREPSRNAPSTVRDELLKHLGPSPLWLAHGAAYESPDALKDALLQAAGTVERLRREEDGRYISEVDGRGLDSLLESPKTSEELAAFAEKTLEPLLEHDRDKGSELTHTFCLTLALGSPEEASEKLFVHPNTVRYRMRRAQEILASDLALPKERTAMSLAAFAWLRRFGKGKL
ncbi:MAG: helix-turn-helix domain-containing protein [Rubrobacteraceae bacterium]